MAGNSATVDKFLAEIFASAMAPASGLYVEDKSFDHIPNPVIDTVGKRICGEARANAREVELTEYRYDGKQFYRESSTTVVFE